MAHTNTPMIPYRKLFVLEDRVNLRNINSGWLVYLSDVPLEVKDASQEGVDLIADIIFAHQYESTPVYQQGVLVPVIEVKDETKLREHVRAQSKKTDYFGFYKLPHEGIPYPYELDKTGLVERRITAGSATLPQILRFSDKDTAQRIVRAMSLDKN